MFRHLKTKLTLAYGGLLGLIFAVISLVVYVTIENTAQAKISDEMRATSAVYERLWELKAMRLEESADGLARDYGLRGAVATQDIAAIATALKTSRTRLDIDAAAIVLADGRIVESRTGSARPAEPHLVEALRRQGSDMGIISLNGVPHQVVSVPIRAPDRIGWVLFGAQLGASKMAELETLSSIPLHAHVIAADEAGTPVTPEPGIVIRESRIPGFGTLPDARLVLEYPLAGAMAPYRPMLLAILIMAVGGVLALLICSWFISRSVTGPITKLDDATRQLASGDRVRIDVRTNDEIGRLAGSFARMADEIEQREDNILRLSLTDTESDLPNRRALQLTLDEAEGEQAPQAYCAAISPDRFSKIIGVIGQSATNTLIATLGARLQAEPGVKMVGRLGTDMLGLVMEAGEAAKARMVLSRVRDAVIQPIDIDGEKVDIQLSVGFARHDGEDRLNTIDRAVIALQQARERRLPVFEFDGEAYGDPSGTLSLMSEMMAGLETGEIHMAYQPKFDLRMQAVCGAEALLRWTHPQRGPVSPETFVRTAEETGHIRPLSEWVLRQVRADRAELQAAGHDVRMSVNLSGRLLTDTEFLDWAIALIGEETGHYCFEVTETTVIDDPALALANIDKLHKAGIEISIDDYGSGLSSLAYLRQIPAHELKIDKSFVMSLQPGSSDALLIKSTIDLAHSLGMTVTAEGVETGEVLALLTGMGADCVQGFYIARPQKVTDILGLLDDYAAQAERPARPVRRVI
ncbi:putative bifunctional diguanylate cyclase/phosphodiesterase [Henriciella aquimarina]|uniref:putative bifunctional diguanylate cyclase/phosphodiesterase n=1 Tax=Henriciella aquimarina TaxID=545261 RepID=UPI0009FBA98E|nr:EAL domain-containing protein [Henriciella aquimarina]